MLQPLQLSGWLPRFNTSVGAIIRACEQAMAGMSSAQRQTCGKSTFVEGGRRRSDERYDSLNLPHDSRQGLVCPHGPSTMIPAYHMHTISYRCLTTRGRRRYTPRQATHIMLHPAICHSRTNYSRSRLRTHTFIANDESSVKSHVVSTLIAYATIPYTAVRTNNSKQLYLV